MFRFCYRTRDARQGKCPRLCVHYRLCNPSKAELDAALEEAIHAIQALETLRAPFPPAQVLREKFLKIAQEKTRRKP